MNHSVCRSMSRCINGWVCENKWWRFFHAQKHKERYRCASFNELSSSWLFLAILSVALFPSFSFFVFFLSLQMWEERKEGNSGGYSSALSVSHSVSVLLLELLEVIWGLFFCIRWTDFLVEKNGVSVSKRKKECLFLKQKGGKQGEKVSRDPQSFGL